MQPGYKYDEEGSYIPQVGDVVSLKRSCSGREPGEKLLLKERSQGLCASLPGQEGDAGADSCYCTDNWIPYNDLGKEEENVIEQGSLTSKVLIKMEFTGGSFVSSLAVAMRHADASNFKKLKETFKTYWIQYENDVIAEEKAEKENAELTALTTRRNKELREKMARTIHDTIVLQDGNFNIVGTYEYANAEWKDALEAIVENLQVRFLIEDANNDDELSEKVKKGE